MVKGTLRVLSVGALVAAAIERLKDLKVGVRAAAAESTKTREALRESEERYRMLVENADDPIGLKDREGRFTMVNSQMEFLLGGSKEEIYGKTSAELFPGQAGIDIHKADQRVLTSGTVIETEQEIPTSLGLRIYVTRKLPIRDQSGEVVGLQSISRDITERRKAEEELRKSEELYRVVVDNAGDSIYTKDAAGRYVMVNSEFERRVRILNSDTSLSREGICGRTTPELFPAPVAARIMDADEKVLSTGMPVETELRVPTDSVTWTHFSRKVPLRDEDGHVTGLVGVSRDITERKLAEAALTQSQERFNAFLNHLPGSAFLKDSDGTYLYVNAGAAAFGWEKARCEGLTDEQLFSPEIAEQYKRNDRIVLETGHSLQTLEPIEGLDGGVALVTKFPIAGEDGVTRLVGGISIDVTDSEAAKQELRKSEELYRVVVEAAGDSIYTKDAAGRYVMVNSEFERRLRVLYSGKEIRQEEILGKTAAELFPPSVAARAAEADHKVLSEGRAIETETDVSTENGTWTHFSRKVPIRNDDGQVTGLVGISRDMTERKQAETALKRSRERFDLFMDHLPGSAFLKDSDGTYVYANAGATAFGLDGTRVEGLTDDELYSPEIAEQYRKNDSAVLETGRSLQTLEPLEGPDGGVALTTKFPISGEDEIPRLVGGISIDVTDYELAKQELRKSEELYRAVVEAAGDPIFTKDAEGRYVMVNSEYERRLSMLRPDKDLRKEEIVGRTASELFPPSVAAQMIDGDDRVLRTGEMVEAEIELQAEGGTTTTTLSRRVPLRNEDGQVVGVLGISRDISDRKRAELEIKRLSDFNRAIIESIPVALTVVNRPERVVVSANTAFCHAFGWTMDEVEGKPISEVLAVEEVEQVIRDTHVDGRPVERREVHLMTGGADERWLDVSAVPLQRPTEEGVESEAEVLLILEDVTQRKQEQDRLQETARLASIGELAAGVAHEINNPLNTILGFTQLMLEDDLPSDIREDLTRIASDGKRAAAVVENLLSFARKREVRRVNVDVAEVVRRSVELKAYDLKSNNIRVNTQLPTSPVTIAADENQMIELMLNILTNAQQAVAGARRTGRIDISVSGSAGRVRVTIADNGPGIPAEHLGRIFDPFFTTKEIGVGTGLGLSICFGIVREHGGEIWVESGRRKGTTFYIELPIQEAEAEVSGEPEARPHSPDVTTGRVLIVEDEPNAREVIIRAVSSMGHIVDHAGNGREAWRKAQEWDETLAEKVIFLTGDTFSERTHDFLASTGRPSLMKPIHVEELRDQVAKLIEGRIGKSGRSGRTRT